MGKLVMLTVAFYAETLVHMMVEEVGTPLNTFMVLAGSIVDGLLKVYGSS